MALQVWLPLNGDLKNKGCADVTVTNNGATVDNNGKIGQCYSFNGTTNEASISGLNFSGASQISISVWLYPTTANVITAAFEIASNTYWQIDVLGKNLSIRDTSTGLTGTRKSYDMGDFPAETWTHLVVTYDSGEIKIYKNGLLFSTQNTGGTKLNNSLNIYKFGRSYNQAYWYKGKLNDLRIYDHCLSAAEVKEISRGLILHYKLDANGNSVIGNTNLIVDGWGGSNNWIYKSSDRISTDVPPSTSFTNSYSVNNETIEYIPLISDHSYTISGYVKKYSSTASTCYLSLAPYDVDKNRITSSQQPDAFRAASRTTLSQDLHNGDTIVHLTDASGWSTTLTYGYYIAIFGYKDSTGYTYPDMVYTRRTYSWGTTTDKSNLDIQNNQLTLNNPYSGDTIPAGTTVCQSSTGSAYYYPSYISASNAEDWVYLTKTFVPQNINYLKAAKYIRPVSLSSYQRIAGYTLIDNTAENKIVDSSGYGNHGIITGTLALSSNTVRYENNTLFNGVDSCITVPYKKCNPSGIFTMNLWFKKDALGSKNYETLFGGPSGFEMDTRSAASTTLSLYMATVRGGNVFSPFNLNEWYMVTMVRDETNELYYINGELKKTIEAKSMPSGNYFIGAWRTVSQQNYRGYISDFRLYCTPLSAEDIRQLYEVSAKIDNKNNLHCYALNEHDVTNSKLYKTGIFKSEEFNEVTGIMQINADKTVDSNQLIEM